MKLIERGVILSAKNKVLKKRHTLCLLVKDCWFRQYISIVKLQRCTCMTENNYISFQFAQYHSGIYSEYRKEIKVHANHKRII